MSNCVWYQLWKKYDTGEITAQELDDMTKNRQQSIRYNMEHISGIIGRVMEGVVKNT